MHYDSIRSNVRARTYALLASLLVGSSLLVSPATAEIDPLDWPTWRGPEQNCTSREKGLVESWDPAGGEGSNLLWKRDDLGTRSTPIIMRGKVYLLARAEPGTSREGEKVVCLDAATGKTIWEHTFNVYLSDVPDTRVGWSSCVGDPETGRIYAQGVCGYFACLEGDSGKLVWSRSLHEELGLLSTYGGRTNVPVIFEDTVIASAVVIGWDAMAKPAHRFMAFDKATGDMIWFKGTRLIPYDTTYSSPTVTVLDGQAAMVFGSGDGAFWALQPRTGEQIWKYQFSRRGLNVSPLVVGDTVYTGHGEENVEGTAMGGLVAIDAAGKGDLTGKELWRLAETMVGKSSPIMIDGKLYCIDDRAKLLVFDPKTGEQLYRKALGTAMRSTPLYADGKIYTCTNNGRWYILRPTESGVEIVHKLRFPQGELSDGSPVVSHGRIYVPTSAALYCLGTPDHQPQADPLPEPPREVPAGAENGPAVVQVVPCEVLLRPGETQKFRVRLLSARGHLLKAADGTFSVEGPGTIDAEGTFTAAADAAHQAAFVTAKVGDLTGQARVRMVPPLPWKFDFESADDVPITWIGGRVRHEVRAASGALGTGKIMVKRDQIPTRPGKFTKLGTRSRLWMGQIDLADYTVQADVAGQEKDGKMPDIGLINQRYTMEMQGASQKLQIRSWSTQLRMATTIPFQWEPDTWYTMKLTTRVDGDKAFVKGKVWPRDDPEPDAWTIEAVDESPNLQGSPGLFGNAKDAEIYLDNILVTPNPTG